MAMEVTVPWFKYVVVVVVVVFVVASSFHCTVYGHSTVRPFVYEFIGEPGVDAGGVAREFFQVLSGEIFNLDFGLFRFVRSFVCLFLSFYVAIFRQFSLFVNHSLIAWSWCCCGVAGTAMRTRSATCSTPPLGLPTNCTCATSSLSGEFLVKLCWSNTPSVAISRCQSTNTCSRTFQYRNKYMSCHVMYHPSARDLLFYVCCSLVCCSLNDQFTRPFETQLQVSDRSARFRFCGRRGLAKLEECVGG